MSGSTSLSEGEERSDSHCSAEYIVPDVEDVASNAPDDTDDSESRLEVAKRTINDIRYWIENSVPLSYRIVWL